MQQQSIPTDLSSENKGTVWVLPVQFPASPSAWGVGLTWTRRSLNDYSFFTGRNNFIKRQ